MHTPTGMHPTLLAGWQLTDRVRGELRKVSSPLTPAQWRLRPDTASWCIAEVVEHLLRAEIGTSKMVRKLIRGDYRTWTLPAGATLYTAKLDRYPYGQLTAPQELNPGPVREQAELEQELGVAHARFRKELEQFRGEDPEALRSPDPATGDWFTLAGWLKLQAWHEAHHVSQVRRTMTAPGFQQR